MRFTRIFALFVCVLSLLVGSVQTASAASLLDFFRGQNSTEKNVYSTVDAVIDSESEGIPSHESFVDDNLLNFQSSAYLFIAGPPEGDTEGRGARSRSSYTEEEQRILAERYGNGVIGGVTDAIVALYNPPASSRTYVADVMESAHIIPEAQAQGLGFASLDPILETWKVFRNIAYLFFVIIFLVIGFMIMFRQKIGGQTVVTAQQAIPGIIVSLVFVTFSYAIAGFLIDLMYLMMYLMIGLFNPQEGASILNKDFLQFGIQLVVGSGGAFATVNETVQGFADAVISAGGEGNVASTLTGFIGGLTLALIVAVAILIGVFKVFFELLKSYITIIIAIATAPLTLMVGALPGKSNVGYWIRIISGNLLAFPVVLFSLILYELFTGSGNLEAGGFIPPYLIGRGIPGAVVSLVGIGILLIIPELIKETKKAVGAEGGVWEQLAGAAGKNAQSGEVGIPLLAGVGAGAWGAARAGIEARRQGYGPRQTLSAMFRTGVTVDPGDGGPPRTLGGAARLAGKAWERGQSVRRTLDRAQEGRLFEAEDIEKTLTRLSRRQAAEDKPAENVGVGPEVQV